MKLYSFDVAPNPRRVGLFMAYKGIDIETINVDLGKKEQLMDDYLAINPAVEGLAREGKGGA
jgi:glutathione S-transferase